jgi:S-DNA-T family DNA segregation ATPase FtsK/SpoIIIE
LRDTLFIVIFAILVYFGSATLFGYTGIFGSFGSSFAQFNHLYFGYLSYVYIFALLYPLYKLYKSYKFSLRTFEVFIASILLLFSFLLAQSLLVTNEMRGKVATDFATYLEPYIGVFGLWVFCLMIFMISVVLLVDKTTQELLSSLKAFIPNNMNILKNIKFPKKTPAVAPKKEPKPTSTNNATTDDAYDEVIQTKQEYAVDDLDQEELEKPAYLRHKTKRVLKKETASATQPSHETTQHVDTKAQEIDLPPFDVEEPNKEVKQTVIVEELEENKKLLDDIEKGKTQKPKNFKLPPLDFLEKPNKKRIAINESEIDDKIEQLIEKLAHFKIEGDVIRTYTGPIVSTFEFKPAANVKVSKILNLQDDLAMALSAETIRIQAPIPGKDVVGIEIPNDTRETIYLREVLESKIFQESASPLTMALGKDIVGKPFVTDLKKLPHLLIAGTTGSGKSVGINAMILSLLYKNSPDTLRLMMIDPKMLEFSIYNDIPHLLTPVITKPKQAVVALNNMVAEMERRYELMADTRTKNIENYNEKIKKTGGEHFPYIVVIIDELSDLMMTSGKDVEISIARLAQKSRACGIHLIVATQRPSVDVVTGLIKANLPSRISYRVGQKVDSKIILDQQGAESLLGRGDMLFTPPGAPGLVRLHAPWATEEEIEKIVEFIKAQREPNYDKSFLVEEEQEGMGDREVFEELDPLFEEAKKIVLQDRKTSISYLQRKLQIGYNRSARVMEQLEQEGILSAPNAKGIREILV